MRWRVGVVPIRPVRLRLFGTLIAGGVLLSLVACGKPEPTPSVVFLSVGQGDCTILQQGDEAILIDTGPRSDGFDAGERIVLKRLRERGVRRLRGVLLSHDDSDHTGGAGALLKAFPGAMAWTGPQSRIPIGPRVRRLDHAGRITFGDFRIDWRFPAIAGPIDNARSSLLGIEARGMKFALTGDSPTGVEEGVVELTGGTVDVYKAGHHGSKSSGSAALLAALRPRFIVVSCGAGNRHGHPHPDAMARYAATGARTLRTDRDGDLEFRWRSGGWELVTTPLDPTLSKGTVSKGTGNR